MLVMCPACGQVMNPDSDDFPVRHRCTGIDSNARLDDRASEPDIDWLLLEEPFSNMESPHQGT